MKTQSPPDIFLSYAHEDELQAQRLAEALAADGWSVFWDRRIPPGETWYSHIGAALEGVRCVIVGWSAASIASNWVLEEAGDARDRGVLVPVLFEDVQPPLGFRSIQACDLSAWDGAAETDAYGQLVAVLQGRLGKPVPMASAAMEPPEEREGAGAEERLIVGQRRQPVDERPGARQDIKPTVEGPPVGDEISPVEGLRGGGERRTEGTPKPGRSRAIPLALVAAGFVGLIGALVFVNQGPPRSVSSREPSTPPLVERRIAKPSAPPPLVEPQTTEREPGVIFRDPLRDGGEGPEMVVVPAGRFRMGDVARDGEVDEHPVHRVEIRSRFAIGRFEVTFEDYDRFASVTRRAMPEDRGFGRGRRPVVNVSWEDASAYASWLSEQTGRRYRLPTEAEWEYAARAGTETPYWWGDEIGRKHANCRACGSEWDGSQTAPVGSFEPNPFGLFDTAGNVWEWVEDCWHKSYDGAPQDGSAWREAAGGNCGVRVVRGGSLASEPTWLRAAYRHRGGAGDRYDDIGFRLAQDLIR